MVLPVAAGAADPDLRDRVPGAGGGATLDKPVSPLSGAQVVAGKGANSASVKATHTSTFSKGDGAAIFQGWSFAASAPLDKTSDDTDITSLDGLVNTANVEFKYNEFRVQGRKRPTAEVLPKLDEICDRVFEAMKKQTGKAPDRKGGCDMAEVRKYSPGDVDAFDNAFWDYDSTSWMWGASAKAGYQNFDFVDASTAKKGKQDETPWSIGGYVGYSPSTSRTLLSTQFQYQHAFKEGKNGTVCPASTGGAVTCATGAIGNPEKVTKKILSLEGRMATAWAGLGLTIDRDFAAGVWGAELPIHFIKDKDGKFSGGVKWGWRSDTHVSSFNVFVGATFGLYK
jgi:hypothetical protein